MVTGFCCKCHSAVPLLRQVFKNAGIRGYLSVPIFQGKEEIAKVANKFPEAIRPKVQELVVALEKRSSYAYVLGWNEEQIEWVDITHGGAKSLSDGKVLAKDYNR